MGLFMGIKRVVPIAVTFALSMVLCAGMAYGDYTAPDLEDPEPEDIDEHIEIGIEIHTVTVKSKKVTIEAWDEPFYKDDSLKLTIGKKVYKKKPKDHSWRVSFKIKKPKVGQKIRARLRDYSGEWVTDAPSSKVYLSKKPRIWYTMKQAKQTAEYSRPDLVWKKNRTYTFWMWADGSTWVFKNGKLRAMK